MISPEKLLEIGINYNAGMERFLNDENLYEAVLNAFIDENLLDKSSKAFESGDDKMLLTIAHEAKGSSGNAGLDNLYLVSCDLVNLLRTKSYTKDELTACYKKFEESYKKVWNGIRAAIQ